MSSYYGLTGETLHRVAVVLRVIVEDEGLRYGRLHTQENAVRDRTTRGSQRVSEVPVLRRILRPTKKCDTPGGGSFFS